LEIILSGEAVEKGYFEGYFYLREVLSDFLE